MTRLGGASIIVGGLSWLGVGLSAVAIALDLPEPPFSNFLLGGGLLFLGLGTGSLVLGVGAPGGRVGLVGAGATAVGGPLALLPLIGGPYVATGIGLWLVLGGSLLVGLDGLRHRDDRPTLVACSTLVGTVLFMSLVGLLSDRGPLGLFGRSYEVDGLSTWTRLVAVVQMAFGGSWAWLGWRVAQRRRPPRVGEPRPPAEKRLVLVVVGLALVVALVGAAGLLLLATTSAPPATSIARTFAGAGSRETESFTLRAARLRFDWAIQGCAGVGPHEVVSISLRQLFDAEHTLDPGPPAILGGAPRRVLVAPLILGSEYGAIHTFDGSTRLDVEGGLWALNVEMPGTCRWTVSMSST
jgi:hypothetical protein